MQLATLLLALPLLGIGIVRAEVIALSGQVTDREGRGLSGITVRLHDLDGIPGDTTYRTMTSKDGSWAISNSSGVDRSRSWTGSIRKVGAHLEVTLAKASQLSVEGFDASGASALPPIRLRLGQGTHAIQLPKMGALSWIRMSVDGQPVHVFSISDLEMGGNRVLQRSGTGSSLHAARTSATTRWYLSVTNGSQCLGGIPMKRLDTAGIHMNVDTSSSPRWSMTQSFGRLYDARDGRVYRTIQIGRQTWMAENLNFEVTGSLWAKGCRYVSMNNCQLFDEAPRKGTLYGRLYSWAAVMGLPDSCNSRWCLTPDSCRTGKCEDQPSVRRRGICPEGWHVPEVGEWDSLVATVEGAPAVGSGNGGRALRATQGWVTSQDISGDIGFRALPAGYQNQDGLTLPGKYGYWLTATERDSTGAHFRGIGFETPYVFNNWVDKANMRSLRCVKD